jgi:site-specific recombinase XerD
MDATGARLLWRQAGPASPTVATFRPRVLQLCPAKSLGTYRAGFNRLTERFAPLPLAAVRAADLCHHRDEIRRAVGVARVAHAEAHGRALLSYDPDAHGQGAAENYVRAVRFFFRCAVADGHLDRSPASDLHPPARLPAPERALSEQELTTLRRVAATSGRDPELDVLLLDFLRHTAARREGALNLRLAQLHRDRLAVTLTEKGGKSRTLPLAGGLLERLSVFAAQRGARRAHDQVFRFRDGTPMTRRRFNALFDRLDRHCAWSEALDVGAHWLRHTTLTDIAAVSDRRVAAEYAGHQLDRRTTIDRYVSVDFEDLVAAYETLFGPRG